MAEKKQLLELKEAAPFLHITEDRMKELKEAKVIPSQEFLHAGENLARTYFEVVELEKFARACVDLWGSRQMRS